MTPEIEKEVLTKMSSFYALPQIKDIKVTVMTVIFSKFEYFLHISRMSSEIQLDNKNNKQYPNNF